MGTFSYTVDVKVPLPIDPTTGRIFLMCGSFTNAQTANSTIAFATDEGMTEVLYFKGVNLTDTDETCYITISDATVTIAVGTNDDDGKWFGIFKEY